MTIIAAIGGNMYRVGEFGAAGTKPDLFNGMAFLAVCFHTESGFSIMAGSARLTLFHVSHGGSYAPFAGYEYLIVAFNTFIHALMIGVVEYRAPGLLDLEYYIDGRFMAAVTITFYTEYRRAVVAAATGSPLFHLRHGKPLVTRTRFE